MHPTKISEMKKMLMLFTLVALLYGCGTNKALVTADKTPIATTIDLINVVDDKVKVSIDPGAFTTDEVSFYIPRTVPGTYSTDNYGQYVEGFKALDYNEQVLSFSKVDENTWKIANAKNLDKVIYFVNDTYDTEREVNEAVFSPAGTNILAGENFMLNLHGFVGYFEGLKEVCERLDKIEKVYNQYVAEQQKRIEDKVDKILQNL